MRVVNNPLSSQSYTNKDFQTIYPELLEAAKSLAKNWDPTISNESDPGVVLLKLCAIIGDKNNYNIDKNVLENYPETYTQEVSARSQYRQLGYKMPWYRAATLPVTFRWVGEELMLGQYVTIPKHTMLTDNSGEYVFTLLDDVTIAKKDYSASLTETGKVMQGVINRLSIVGSDVITLSHLDSNNRLYINDHNIAENGIFVRNVNDTSLWYQVYNVETQSPNTKCYEFDIDARKNCPYIQFPSDVHSTIGKGLIVEYITTDGYAGNIAANTIDSYLNESTIVVKSVDLSVSDTSVPLNVENVKIFNAYATTETTADVDITVGKDPETIEEARVSYRKVVGTFDTLVTLRDYINAIYRMTPEVVSNVVVSDRTNDIQCSYRIVSKYPSVSDTMTYMTGKNKVVLTPDVNGTLKKDNDEFISAEEGDTNKYKVEEIEEKDMTPFDLKLYLLKTGDTLPMISADTGMLKYSDKTMKSYDDTFLVDNEKTTRDIISLCIEESKSIQHDFVDIKPELPFMLQAVYPIKLKIIPSYKLTDDHKNQVEANIKSTLIKLLNSRECEFGVEPDYNIIYNAITSCDERIKTVIMDDFVYTLFAVYMENNGEFKYVPVSDYSTCDRAIVLYEHVDGKEEAKIKYGLTEKMNIIKRDVGTSALEDYIFIDAHNGIMYKADVDEDSVTLTEYSRKLNDLREQIIAKNILAGVTPLYDVSDSIFTTTIDMQHKHSEITDRISTDLEITPFGRNTTYDAEKRTAEYTLKDNESIRCLAPSFIMKKSYSSYTKFEVVLKNPIRVDNSYEIADPNDEDDIIKRYGYGMFYEKANDGFTPKNSTTAYLKFEPVKRFCPEHHYREIESGTAKNYVFEKFGDWATPVVSGSKVVGFELEFEPYVYYTKDGDEYKPITKYPEGWGPDYYTSCYKLRQVIPTPVYLPLSKYCVAYSIKSYSELEERVSGILYKLDNGVYSNEIQEGFEAIYNSVTVTSTSDNKYFVDISSELNSNDTSISYSTNFDENCFIPLKRYGSDVYKVLKNGDEVIGYEMVMLGSETGTLAGAGEYIKVTDPFNWSQKNFKIKYFDSTGLGMSDILFVPTLPAENIYTLEDSSTYVKVTDLNIPSSEWSSDYSKYYRMEENYPGVHPTSSEYLKWKSGMLNLYLPATTYKIPANTEYQLRDGDSVKFFWRDVDESDAPYNYTCYKGTEYEDSPIIKADFAITANTPIDEIILSSKLDSSGLIPYDMGIGSDYYKIYYQMAGGEWDLGASRKIEIRQINQVKMKKDGNCKNRYYYVVTNNIERVNGKKYYTLNLQKVSESTSNGVPMYRYKHILQPDEYFFYVNEDRTLYGVVGEGTLIDYRTKDSQNSELLKLQSEVVSTTDISFRGISVFKDLCKEISKDEDIRLVEQQVYAFTSGDTVKFSFKPGVASEYVKADALKDGEDYYEWTLEFKSVALISTSTTDKNIPPFVPNYYYEYDKDDNTYEVLSSEPDKWRTVENGVYGCTNYFVVEKSEFTKVNSPKESDISKYYVKVDPEYPVIKTSTPLLLDNIDIYYSTKGSDNEDSDKIFTQLPPIDVTDDECKWSATAYLNLNMSPTTAQRIGKDDDQSSHKVSIGTAEYETKDKDLYLMSSIPINRTGGKNVDITWMNMYGESEKVKILAYQVANLPDDGAVKLSNNDEIEFKVVAGKDSSLNLTEVQLESGFKYMLPIEIMTDDIVVKEIYAEPVTTNEIRCVCCNQPVLTMGKHFIPIDCSTKKLRITCGNNTMRDSSIKLSKLFKYKHRELFGGEEDKSSKYEIYTGDLEKIIRSLDIPREFDYCHVPIESEQISDPLDPISVFSSNHVFNKFSIPRAEIRTEKPFSASIDFVNNR